MDDPFSAKNIVPTLWMAAVAAVGGWVSFHQKVKAGSARYVNFTELVGEMVVSAFVGILTYWLCKGFMVNEWLTAAAVAVSGHMGARAMFLAEKTAEDVLGKLKDKV